MSDKLLYCRLGEKGALYDSHEPGSSFRTWWYTLEHNIPLTTLRTWVSALRSGNYHQIQDELYGFATCFDWKEPSEDDEGEKGYCCLGVLGSVCGIEDSNLFGESLLEGYMCDVTGMMPETTTTYAIGSNAGSKDNPRILQDLLSGMNDRGWTFDQIADWIETNLLEEESDEIRI